MSERISVIVNRDDQQKTLNVMDRLQENLNYFRYWAVQFGTLAEDIIISFNIPQENIKDIVGVLVLNQFHVMPGNKVVDEIILEAKSAPKPSIAPTYKKTRIINKVYVEEQVKHGNYEEIINVWRDISQKQDVKDFAKENITNALTIAIETAFNESMTKERKREESVEILMNIATNKYLKSLQQAELMRHAGITAINICSYYSDLVKNLVKIVNTNSVYNIINAKAAAKLSKVSFENTILFKDELAYAVKNLNLRWLQIALDVVIDKLNDEEKDQINKIIQYVKTERNKPKESK